MRAFESPEQKHLRATTVPQEHDVEPKSLLVVEPKDQLSVAMLRDSTKHAGSLRRDYNPIVLNTPSETLPSDDGSVGFQLRSRENERMFQYLEQAFSSISANTNSLQTARPQTVTHRLVQQSRQAEAVTQRPSCRCQCHKGRTSLQSARWALMAFRSALGSFSLHFTVTNATPSSRDSSTCNIPECKFSCQKRSSVRVTYTFPTWLFHTAVTAVFSDRLGTPELLLRVIRRIPPASISYSIMGNVRRGEIYSVRRELQMRRHTVFDVHGVDGTTLIGSAILRQNLDLIRLLIQEGADIFQEDDKGNAPFRDVLMQIYATPHLSPRYRQELEGMMPIDQALEQAELPDLHKIAMGIMCWDIREYLQGTDIDVNAMDAFDRTALWYASCKGDIDAVAALLATGAQPNLDPGYGPLHIASRYGHYEVACRLLDAGADVDARSQWLVTPLMSAAATTYDTEAVAAELVRRGADVNAINNHGTSALSLASNFDKAALVQMLVDADADINHCDNDGDSHLMDALASNAREAAVRLLQLGIDLHLPNKKGEGPLHELARFANRETMETFTRMPHLLSGLDPEERTFRGSTAMELCLEREASDAVGERSETSLAEVFARLLAAVASAGSDDVSDGEEEFFDAYEGDLQKESA